jgi:hypothetical protein
VRASEDISCPRPCGHSDRQYILHATTQADGGDIAGSVPDQRTEASHTNFLFPSEYESYVYTILQSIKCAIA